MSCKGMSVIAGAALVAAGFVGGSIVSSTIAGPDDKYSPTNKQTTGAGAVDQEAMMAAMIKAATPGPQHAELAKRAGKWNVTMKHWEDPSQPPQESQGTATMKMVMDGRYLVENFEGSAMGMPFKGMGISAFDNVDQKYKMVWVDNFSTGMMIMEGDKTVKNTLTSHGSYTCPLTGDQQHMKAVSTEPDANTSHCEFFSKTPEGGWTKMMELHYTRAQ